MHKLNIILLIIAGYLFNETQVGWAGLDFINVSKAKNLSKVKNL